ncbi:class I SAM-dependent methyltransferase [Candidatus Finniella inopinata]|uniref:Class I SAM-dependent methyltransferase n=1 Tax=Candidatus Finniella inopinata TaxID=1696036 RepID=A0A4V2DZR2_9PROT|nr:methyltransferase domain-containing protein [Candidatus Finniella inopinata]RZI45947.1 class I SAM-dependent methyltransferase [Candidatus Finniella inopinata]
MTTDVIDLRDFYASSLGTVVQKDIKKTISTIWPNYKNQVVLGFGYAPPFLEAENSDLNDVYFFMPAQQGVLKWPPFRPTLSALVDENLLPLADQTIDRILCVHGLENCHSVDDFLQDAWRVLKPEGRILFVAPNRRGLWACADNNPFGFGRPYTMTQLSKLLRNHLLTPVTFRRSLYRPPSCSGFFSMTIPLWEYVGRHCLQKFSGLIYIEATKQIYAPRGKMAFAKKLKLAFPSPLAGQHAQVTLKEYCHNSDNPL